MIALYRQKEFNKKFKELKRRKHAEVWARKVIAFKLVKKIFKHYQVMRQVKIDSERKIKSAILLVRNARRYYSNFIGQRGRTYSERIQRKISFALIPVFYLK